MDARQLYLIAAAIVALFVTMLIVIVASISGGPSTSSDAAQAADRPLPPYWIVREGQSYETIAAKTGLSVEDLETFNPHQDPRSLVPGQAIKLRLRTPPRGRKRGPGPRVWIVRRGQTFASIAAKTGHSVLDLQRLNPRLKPTALQPGQRMTLRR